MIFSYVCVSVCVVVVGCIRSQDANVNANVCGVLAEYTRHQNECNCVTPNKPIVMVVRRSNTDWKCVKCVKRRKCVFFEMSITIITSFCRASCCFMAHSIGQNYRQIYGRGGGTFCQGSWKEIVNTNGNSLISIPMQKGPSLHTEFFFDNSLRTIFGLNNI